jgi:hypothetical protein
VALANGQHDCVVCHGEGWITWVRQPHACNCVYRAVFRLCLERHHRMRYEFNACRPSVSKLRRGGLVAGYPSVEYMADFELLCRRVLDPWHRKLWRLFHMQEREFTDCLLPLRTNRGAFFHGVYRVEERVGRAAIEMEPYPLYPFSAYFGGTAVVLIRSPKAEGRSVSHIQALAA